MALKLHDVLIIDDSITNLQVIGSILDKEKYQVFFAESGQEALDIIEKNELPDVILLDIMMPEMDGFDFKRKLNANPKWAKIPVIVISALHEQDNKSIAFKLGCVDYMVKPINKTEVANRIQVQIEMKEHREELQKINEELSIANSTREKIFSIISHDLRTSIGNIRNVFKFMIDGLIDINEDKELIIDAEITSRNTYNLLENLLFWAKSQQGQIVYQPELVNVSRVIGSILEIEKGSIVNKKIQIEDKVEANMFIWTDKVLLTIIVRNLIGNAMKFSDTEGVIIIDAKEKEASIEICITDNGVGISKQNLNKLKSQTMFTTTGTENEKGTGLGLVLVKDCVNKCNGDFSIESELGKGSKFSFVLPKEGQ